MMMGSVYKAVTSIKGVYDNCKVATGRQYEAGVKCSCHDSI